MPFSSSIIKTGHFVTGNLPNTNFPCATQSAMCNINQALYDLGEPDMAIMKFFGKFLTSLLQGSLKKMDRIATVNVVLIFALTMFAAIDAVGNSLISLVYSIADGIGQSFFNHAVHQSNDSTPFWQYELFLTIGFVICLFIVKKNNEGKLW